MNKINLITAPDKLYNDNYSFLLVYPNNSIKEQFNTVIEKIDNTFNLYLYEHASDDHHPDWLLSLAREVDCVVLDIDNCPPEISKLSSYFIAKSNTFWLTNGEDLFYNKISPNRIYNLDNLVEHIGGTLERQ